mmetsp:Transcript_17340/g.23825  ORF Transcript_17340/g.23825 Transcript_17340/m.23825 type:complete len:227 (+) Transcript_17340:1000-1680(+)
MVAIAAHIVSDVAKVVGTGCVVEVAAESESQHQSPVLSVHRIVIWPARWNEVLHLHGIRPSDDVAIHITNQQVVSEAQVSGPMLQTSTVTLQQTSPFKDVVLDQHSSYYQVAACIRLYCTLFCRTWNELEAIVGDVSHQVVLENHFIANHGPASAIITEWPEPQFIELIVTHIEPSNLCMRAQVTQCIDAATPPALIHENRDVVHMTHCAFNQTHMLGVLQSSSRV